MDLWLNTYDVDRFEFFKKYSFSELNGNYFVNSIKGYNPSMSKQAVTVELIKIP